MTLSSSLLPHRHGRGRLDMVGNTTEGLHSSRDDLKKVFTSNYAGARGHAGTRMDLDQVKQLQGESLRSYMR